ncbi:uncharacterized protein EV420DRAFT_1484633 [Desarmillaria tabescens]|uniref:Uncharacterized protein n=1 Tax=Armillaria tabescens TaxID=1929756 RepID=A0AA39MSE7_ARMTA|nr:uncharacterized protein EV420DRAFT_1484633 [Desarmillaria tabescens]KAK0444513.1 hypothetical protein EV420DRAFT_1484633 [Desarmillaria tabescens]
MMVLNNNHVPQTPHSSCCQEKSSMAQSPLYTGHSAQHSHFCMELSIDHVKPFILRHKIHHNASEHLHQTQEPIPCNYNNDVEYFSEPFFMLEELNSVDGLETYAPLIIPAGFKENDPYIKATNNMKKNISPGDLGTHSSYHMVLNGKTCSVHQGWDTTSKLVLNFMSASFFQVDSCSDAKESCHLSFHLILPSPSKGRKPSLFAGHPLNPLNIFGALQSLKAGSSASAYFKELCASL